MATAEMSNLAYICREAPCLFRARPDVSKMPFWLRSLSYRIRHDPSEHPMANWRFEACQAAETGLIPSSKSTLWIGVALAPPRLLSKKRSSPAEVPEDCAAEPTNIEDPSLPQKPMLEPGHRVRMPWKLHRGLLVRRTSHSFTVSSKEPPLDNMVRPSGENATLGGDSGQNAAPATKGVTGCASLMRISAYPCAPLASLCFQIWREPSLHAQAISPVPSFVMLHAEIPTLAPRAQRAFKTCWQVRSPRDVGPCKFHILSVPSADPVTTRSLSLGIQDEHVTAATWPLV